MRFLEEIESADLDFSRTVLCMRFALCSVLSCSIAKNTSRTK